MLYNCTTSNCTTAEGATTTNFELYFLCEFRIPSKFHTRNIVLNKSTISSDEAAQQQREDATPTATETTVDRKEDTMDTEMKTSDAEGSNDAKIDEPPKLSRDDNNDSDNSSTSSKDSSSSKDEKCDPEILLIKAAALKEEGNNYFVKEKDFEKASRSYRKGVNAIKKLNNANSGDEQVKTLLLSLNTNLSMMFYKLGKYRQSKDVANNALEIDPVYVKARYRRALAHRKLGNTDEATMDLKLCLQTEPNNAVVRKELSSIHKEIQKTKKAQKDSRKQLQKAFSQGGLLNDDRVEDEKAKAARLEKEKKKAEENLKKRKQKWEDDCVSRMAKGEESITYEDWDKEQLEKLYEEEEATRKQKEEEKKRKAERKKAKVEQKASKQGKDDDDDDEFTEKELAEMRGYKKTADGRVTSYFTREQSAEEKAMLDIAPKPLSDCTPQLFISTSSKGDAASAWNHAGTWEEKDTTEWCKNHLEKRLLQTKVEAPGSDVSHLSCSITEVKDVEGDASVAIVSGKSRYIFDLHCKVNFEIKNSTSDDVIASGSLKLPDICSTDHDELEVEIGVWKTKPSGANQQVYNDCRLRIVSEVRESIKLWVEDFNNQY